MDCGGGVGGEDGCGVGVSSGWGRGGGGGGDGGTVWEEENYYVVYVCGIFEHEDKLVFVDLAGLVYLR